MRGGDVYEAVGGHGSQHQHQAGSGLGQSVGLGQPALRWALVTVSLVLRAEGGFVPVLDQGDAYKLIYPFGWQVSPSLTTPLTTKPVPLHLPHHCQPVPHAHVKAPSLHIND